MVHEINRSMAPDEVLSDKVQIYDTRRKALVNARDHERMQKEHPCRKSKKHLSYRPASKKMAGPFDTRRIQWRRHLQEG